MATGLDIAAGVAGLITLADIVINRTYKTIKACRSAGADSQRLLREVQSLLGMLHGLKLLADEASNGSLGAYIPAQGILDCQRTLTSIRDKLSKADPDEPGIPSRTKFKRILKWPFSASDMNNVMEELERYKTMFDLSLNIETLQSVFVASQEQRKIAHGIEDVRKTLQDLTRVQLSNERRKFLEAFGTFDVENSHGTNSRLRMEGTGLWLTKGPHLSKWLSSRNAKLWMYGIPGAGKTVLAGAAIEETISYAAPEYAIAYYYCDYKIRTSQELSRILSSIIGQLARQSEECLVALQDLCRSEDGQSSAYTVPTETELSSLFQKAVSHFDEVALIIDGVDECPRSGAVAFALANLVSRNASVRLLISSRDEIPIRTHLEDFEHLSIAAQNEDLKLYVSSELQIRVQLGELRLKNTTLKDEILDRLVNGAEGMFRWVTCQLDHLCKLPTDAARRRALSRLPRGLYETYDRILETVKNNSHETRILVERVLKWLCGNDRLPSDALCEAISIDSTVSTLDLDARPDIESVLLCCSSLVRKSPHSKTLELAHFTVKEYLCSDQVLQNPDTKRYFCDEASVDLYKMTTCLAYLGSEDFAQVRRDDFESYQRLISAYPFYQHAAMIWTYCSSWDDFTLKLAEDFLCSRPVAFATWKRVYTITHFNDKVRAINNPFPFPPPIGESQDWQPWRHSHNLMALQEDLYDAEDLTDSRSQPELMNTSKEQYPD